MQPAQQPGDDSSSGAQGAHELSLASQCRLLGMCHPPTRVTADAISFVSACDASAPFYTATLPAPDADPERVIAQACDVSRASGRPQYVWAPAGSDLARECWRRGLRDAGPLAVMQRAADGSNLLPDDVIVVSSTEDADLFRAVHLAARAGQPDARDVVQHFASDTVLFDPAVRAVVRVDADTPVAAGYLLAADDVPCGLYWIHTDARHRRRGHGAAVVQALLALAPAGRPVVLQATAMGYPVYAQAGFVDHGFVDRWVVTG